MHQYPLIGMGMYQYLLISFDCCFASSSSVSLIIVVTSVNYYNCYHWLFWFCDGYSNDSSKIRSSIIIPPPWFTMIPNLHESSRHFEWFEHIIIPWFSSDFFFSNINHINMERSTMLLIGKLTNCLGPCSSSQTVTNYQRVSSDSHSKIQEIFIVEFSIMVDPIEIPFKSH